MLLMHWLRHFLICCLIAVILPWGAFVKAASPQAVTVATPAGSGISMLSADPVMAPQPKRCRIAILVGLSCVAAILNDGAAVPGESPWESDAPFTMAIALPEGVATGGHLDPPRIG